MNRRPHSFLLLLSTLLATLALPAQAQRTYGYGDDDRRPDDRRYETRGYEQRGYDNRGYQGGYYPSQRDEVPTARDFDRRNYDYRGRRLDRPEPEPMIVFQFGDVHRREIRDYYGREMGRGNCPPGFYRHGRDCLPPEMDSRWDRGQPIPRDLRYYSLPRQLLSRLPPPPPGHRYVMIGTDVLLISSATGVVIDILPGIVGY